ncbi:MAG: GntR family transcriptional regulator [Acidimicrobiaceae bacterium]|nr:GntR family transcriptional regulator [Acidimicrobiaceae bacterium]
MTRKPAVGSLVPAQRRVLADEAADAIRSAIVSGDLVPGRRLIEDELAFQLGVSRGPVREALARLTREGLVLNEHHRGAIVACLSGEEVEEIYSLRTALECLAAERVCTSATVEDLQAIERIVEYIDELPKPLEKLAVANLDLDFHDAVFRAAHHNRLYAAWEGLRSQIFLFLMSGGDLTADFEVSWRRDHEIFLEALRRRELPALLEVVEGHVESTYRRVR